MFGRIEAIAVVVFGIITFLALSIPSWHVYIGTIFFYATLILLVILVRHKLDWQGAIGLYRTKVGLSLMQRWGKKYRGLVQILGLIGIGVAFVGMGFIVFTLLQGVWNLFFNPGAPPVVSPVLPGISIPGTNLKVPLITGWLALFIVIVIHEFSHGVVSRAHGIKVKASGLLVMGPIAGAFVEPDEKKLEKADPAIQYSIFAAGPFSNILTGFLFLLIAAFLIFPSMMGLTSPGGIELTSVTEGSPAAMAGLHEDLIVTGVNGVAIQNSSAFLETVGNLSAGDHVVMQTTAGVFDVEAADRDGKGWLGINLQSYRKPHRAWLTPLIGILGWLEELFTWLFMLSLGIGLANLLPLGPVDGGQMFRAAARQVAGKERGDVWWKRLSVVVLVIIVVLLLIAMAHWFI